MRKQGWQWVVPALGALLAAHAAARAQEPRRLTGSEVTPAVWGVLELPRAAGTHPGVILLYGSSGWRTAYADLARRFADSGFVALALDYYREAGPAEVGSPERRQAWPRWQAAVRAAAAYLQGLPEVRGRPVGLVGYSLGAFLAVSVATSVPAGAVVDYFGGGSANGDSLRQAVQRFPPLLILHGEADSVVPVSQAHRLREAVLAQGGDVEMHLYPGAGHGFNAPWSPVHSESLDTDSFNRAVEFLRRRLGAPAPYPIASFSFAARLDELAQATECHRVTLPEYRGLRVVALVLRVDNQVTRRVLVGVDSTGEIGRYSDFILGSAGYSIEAWHSGGQDRGMVWSHGDGRIGRGASAEILDASALGRPRDAAQLVMERCAAQLK